MSATNRVKALAAKMQDKVVVRHPLSYKSKKRPIVLTDVKNNADFEKRWLAELKKTYGAAAAKTIESEWGYEAPLAKFNEKEKYTSMTLSAYLKLCYTSIVVNGDTQEDPDDSWM